MPHIQKTDHYLYTYVVYTSFYTHVYKIKPYPFTIDTAIDRHKHFANLYIHIKPGHISTHK